LIAIGCYSTYDFVNAKQPVIFSNPTEKQEEVFVKNEIEHITGNIITNEEVETAEISFDGQMWRSLEVSEIADGYSFDYEWTVAGKGKFFIIVNAYSPDGDLIEGRILSEVYAPPDSEEEGLKSMLTNYRIEQEAKQAKEKMLAAMGKNKIGTFTAFESFSEKTVGEFLLNDWKSLLPTREQIEFAMSSTVYIYNFVNTYQAGIDIFFLLTLPLSIILIVLVFMFVFLDHSSSFFEYLYYLIKKPKKSNSNKTGVLFDVYSLYRIPYAKIVLRNIQTNSKHDLVSDLGGNIDLTNLENGEYNYEVQKHGYKTHILDEFDLQYFQDTIIARDNNIIVDDNMKISMPAERLISLERKHTNDKASIFYKPKNWFLGGLSTWISVGCLIMVLYMIFINMYYPIVISIYLLLAYIIYYAVIKTHCSWGIVYYIDNKKATGEKMELHRNDCLFGVEWTDFEGKFGFDGIERGTYSIKPGDKWKIVSNSRYYDGRAFDIGEDKCLLKKNVILEKATK